MKPIIAQFVLNKEIHQYAASKSDRQSKDVDAREEFILTDIAKRRAKVAGEHMTLVSGGKKKWYFFPSLLMPTKISAEKQRIRTTQMYESVRFRTRYVRKRTRVRPLQEVGPVGGLEPLNPLRSPIFKRWPWI